MGGKVEVEPGWGWGECKWGLYNISLRLICRWGRIYLCHRLVIKLITQSHARARKSSLYILKNFITRKEKKGKWTTEIRIHLLLFVEAESRWFSPTDRRYAGTEKTPSVTWPFHPHKILALFLSLCISRRVGECLFCYYNVRVCVPFYVLLVPTLGGSDGWNQIRRCAAHFVHYIVVTIR